MNHHACCIGNIMALEFGSLMQPVSKKHSLLGNKNGTQFLNTLFYIMLTS
jgi:hypothetical protein